MHVLIDDVQDEISVEQTQTEIVISETLVGPQQVWGTFVPRPLSVSIEAIFTSVLVI